jgi:HEAT repeat protein
MLEQQRSQLLENQSETVRLRAEVDRHVALISQLMAEDLPEKDTSADTADGAEGAQSESDAESRPIDYDTLAAAFTEVRFELEEAEDWIEELEIAAVRELERSTEASRVLVAIGAPAVPALVATLHDPNAELRRWAAVVLGRMGGNAVEAVDALLGVARDENQRVQAAAKEALDLISRDLQAK